MGLWCQKSLDTSVCKEVLSVLTPGDTESMYLSHLLPQSIAATRAWYLQTNKGTLRQAEGGPGTLRTQGTDGSELGSSPLCPFHPRLGAGMAGSTDVPVRMNTNAPTEAWFLEWTENKNGHLREIENDCTTVDLLLPSNTEGICTPTPPCAVKNSQKTCCWGS